MNPDRWRRIEQVCHDALTREARARAAFLDQACGDDGDLRAQVEALLAEEWRAERFLETPAHVVAETAPVESSAASAPTLPAGVRFGPYEIVGLLGAGGMGQVYQARDTRLGRTVAIKVLPPGLATDPDRRARFTREARAIAALNHPHICTLHDIGEQDGTTFLVMERLAGETLAARLAKGPLPLAQVLELGAEIADALAAAHREGVIHRDLKPGNVVLTETGAKLLDFGLAELKAPAAAGAASSLPTSQPVSTGLVLGTVPYMAPEQLEGKPADPRTDLWALGALLYEMVTGARAFEGDSHASVMTAILRDEPKPLSERRTVAPPALDRLIRKCLAKDPDDRWQHATDVAEELRGILQNAVAPTLGRTPARSRHVWTAGVAALLVVILVGALAWGVREVWWPTTPTPARTEFAMPEGAVFGPSFISVAVVPDGMGLVYVARDQAGRRLYWQGLDGSRPRAIPGTNGAGMPFFSPDGTNLGFGLGTALVALALPGGEPREGTAIEPLVDLPAFYGWSRGASWGEDGTILYSPQADAGLWRVSAHGGDAREVTRPDPAKNESGHRWPCFLPGGRAALFTIMHTSGRQDRSAIGVLSLDTGKWKRLIEGGAFARYLPPGYVVYARNGALLAVRFDLKTLTTIGSPVPVATGIAMDRVGPGNAWFDVSASGSLVFAPASDVPVRNSLMWVDHDGQADSVTSEERDYWPTLALSSDGQKLAVATTDAHHHNLAVYHLDSRSWQPLTSNSDESCPVWSPTGDRLAFASNRDGAFNLYITRPDKPTEAERLTDSSHWQYPISWSPDGRFLAYLDQPPGWTTWILPLDGDRQPWRLGPDEQNVSGAAFSPDGRWLAYQSTVSGKWQVDVRPFPGPGTRLTVSGAEGGTSPVWTPDGRQILYLSAAAGDNRVLARDVLVGSTLRFAPPHVAFALPFGPLGRDDVDRVLTLAPDGRRLLLVRPDPAAPTNSPCCEAESRHSLTLVRHWVEDVKAKVAAGGR